MIRLLALGLVLALAGQAAAQTPVAQLSHCLAETDDSFRRTAGQPPQERWARLQVLAAGDSRCLATVAAICTSRKAGAAACFDDLSGFVTPQRRAHLRQLPEKLEKAPPGVADSYARWYAAAVQAHDTPSVSGCPFAADAPPVACAALEAGTAWMQARDWARMIAVIKGAGR